MNFHQNLQQKETPILQRLMNGKYYRGIFQKPSNTYRKLVLMFDFGNVGDGTLTLHFIMMIFIKPIQAGS